MPRSSLHRKIYSEHIIFLFIFFFSLYVGLAWIASGGDTWWVIDFVDRENIFHGDDAYRFFLSRSAWVDPDLYTYNFVLPGQLLLDGIIVWMAQGELFPARCFHAAIGAAGVCLIYLAGIELKISRSIMLCAVLIIGLMPRYALMSLSFYGEVWLGLFICLSLWLYLRGHFIAMALVASWMPLFRPEGIFFLAPLCLQMLIQKRFRVMLLMVLPGVAYLLYLYFSLPSLADYNYWREEQRQILSKVARDTSIFDALHSYSLFLLMPASFAFFLPSARKLWAFLVGAVLWLVFLQTAIHQELAAFENRYVYVVIPLLIIAWAIFWSWVIEFSTTQNFHAHLRKFILFSIPLVSMIISLEHMVKTDNIDQEIKLNGYSGLLSKMWSGDWDKLYGYYPSLALQGRKEIVQFIEELLERDENIDKVAIGSVVAFYNLDPNKVPDDVTVGFLTNSYMEFYRLLDGQTFIQHPGGRMYTYLNYGEPDFGSTEKRILVAAPMPLSGYPYSWIRGENELYLFSYKESWAPQTDLSDRARIAPTSYGDSRQAD